MKILIVNGPNINMLGIREPNIYGENTYKQLVKSIKDYAKSKKVKVRFFQSNHEGKIVDALQKAYFKKYDGIVINPAAYTHTSIAILDAVKSINIPTVEVHISNLCEREEFRWVSYVSQAVIKTISGQGFNGYNQAIDLLVEYKK